MNDLSAAFADLRPEMKIREVIDLVVDITGVPHSDILSPKRDRVTARARQMVMWKAHKEGHSLPAIGRVLGRDHTSVLHGVRQINRRLGL
jgi:chromosomal replication initiation ATPase DnaA